MLVDPRHEFFFEHDNGHVPGMMLLEAGKQAAVYAASSAFPVVTGMYGDFEAGQMRFGRFADLSRTVWMSCRFASLEETRAGYRAAVEIAFEQGEREIGRIGGVVSFLDRREVVEASADPPPLERGSAQRASSGEPLEEATMTSIHPGRVAVVGAGMSGVAAAHALSQAGYRPEIIEAGPTLGGRAGSMQLGGKNIDIGGKNIGRKYLSISASSSSTTARRRSSTSGSIRRPCETASLHTLDSQKKLASLWHVLRLVGVKDFARLFQLAQDRSRSSRGGHAGRSPLQRARGAAGSSAAVGVVRAGHRGLAFCARSPCA